MKTVFTVAVSMIAGVALGMAINGLQAQIRTPGAYAVVDIAGRFNCAIAGSEEVLICFASFAEGSTRFLFCDTSVAPDEPFLELRSASACEA